MSQSDTTIRFGDPRVLTAYSDDALLLSLPALGGRESASLGAACDYARYCSAVDFWVAADHAESLTPSRWRSAVETIEQCNAVATTEDPRATTAHIGFTWTRSDPDTLTASRSLWVTDNATALVTPPHSIGIEAQARQVDDWTTRLRLLLSAPARRTLDYLTHARATRQHINCSAESRPSRCAQRAATPTDVMRLLGDAGTRARSVMIESTQGAYVAAGAMPAFDVDGSSQLFEIMSGHGAAEVYRPFRPARIGQNGDLTCPAPLDNFVASCWIAGEIVYSRCRSDGVNDERCRARATAARALYLAYEPGGHRVIGGARADDWVDGNQCRDCFMPAFNYRPTGSAQYLLAARRFDAAGTAERHYLGFVGSSASHRARPGNGYKEQARALIADVVNVPEAPLREALFGRVGADIATAAPPTASVTRHLAEHERAQSFRYSGALTAVHVPRESAPAMSEALDQRRVYATSGDRILLWFSLDNGGSRRRPMGSRVETQIEPRFHVTAAGALKQLPGCPPAAIDALGPMRIEQLCRTECYHPADERKLISRIEIVRIRPQRSPDESIDALIDDPWRVHVCKPDPLGCRFDFSDPEYVSGERDVTYYARVIQAPSLAINGAGLRCEYDDNGRCVAMNPCRSDSGNPDCLAPVEERAWSSPIYLEWTL